MNIEEQHITLFEQYLSNSMDENSLHEFEARLLYDTDFKCQFEQFKSIEQGIKEHYKTELKNKFSEIDKELDKEHIISKPKRNKIIWLSTALAASIIVGFLIIQHFSTQVSLNQLALENWEQDEGLPVKMSNKGKYDDAMNAYKLEEWNLALKELNKITSDTATYYSAVIYFEIKDFKNSLKLFDKIEENSIYYEEAQFRKALNYLSLEKKKEALEILSRIGNNKKSIYRDKTKRIMESLQIMVE
jgi:tetratricopeptide (TPR) repeat protein